MPSFRIGYRSALTASIVRLLAAMPRQDFLEVLCRIARLKALPTDDEVRAVGSGDAATYLLELESSDPDAFGEFVRTHALPWGAASSMQPLERCVEHLCHVLIADLQGGIARDPNAGFNMAAKDVRRALLPRFVGHVVA